MEGITHAENKSFLRDITVWEDAIKSILKAANLERV